MEKLIERTEYLNELIRFKDKHSIKVVTGVRRCGKSTLLEMYQNRLLSDGISKEQIIYINFEDYDCTKLKDKDALYSYVKGRLLPDKMNYVFFDEIQHVDDFPVIADSLYIKKNVDLYLTGSNSQLLSSEIATLLTGRYVEISMLPLSFREYVGHTGDERELPRKFSDYLETGSFPGALEYGGDRKAVASYMTAIYNSIVTNDIVNRKKITDTMMLKDTAGFMLDNIGNPLSSRKIADTLSSEGRRIDVRTVEKFIDGLTESFVFYRAGRYNIKGKEYLKTLGKYYAVDVGLRYAVLGSRRFDIGRMLENVVYLELRRRGYEVYVGKLDSLEVDFVAVSPKEQIYYQAAATVRDSNTLERELRPLQKIADNYPKFILTLDDDPEANYDGIRRTNALDWLMGKSQRLA